MHVILNNILHAIQLQRPVHGRRRYELGVPSKPDSGGHSCVVVEDLQLLPLLAHVHSEQKVKKIDHIGCQDSTCVVAYMLKKVTQFLPDVSTSNSKVSTALIERQILDLVTVIQLKRLEIFQLPQIPQFDTSVVSSGGQVVPVFRKRYGSDGSRMS